jgi:hypothetical protein
VSLDTVYRYRCRLRRRRLSFFSFFPSFLELSPVGGTVVTVDAVVVLVVVVVERRPSVLLLLLLAFVADDFAFDDEDRVDLDDSVTAGGGDDDAPGAVDGKLDTSCSTMGAPVASLPNAWTIVPSTNVPWNLGVIVDDAAPPSTKSSPTNLTISVAVVVADFLESDPFDDVFLLSSLSSFR